MNEKVAMLEMELDLRLASAWREVWKGRPLSEKEIEMVGAFMRYAYALGYQDGQDEPQGELHRLTGYTPPRQRT